MDYRERRGIAPPSAVRPRVATLVWPVAGHTLLGEPLDGAGNRGSGFWLQQARSEFAIVGPLDHGAIAATAPSDPALRFDAVERRALHNASATRAAP